MTSKSDKIKKSNQKPDTGKAEKEIRPSKSKKQKEDDDESEEDPEDDETTSSKINAGPKSKRQKEGADDDDDDNDDIEDEKDDWEKPEEEEEWDPDFDEFDIPKSRGKKSGSTFLWTVSPSRRIDPPGIHPPRTPGDVRRLQAAGAVRGGAAP